MRRVSLPLLLLFLVPALALAFRIFNIRSGPSGNSPGLCADCHTQIHREWSDSPHASSFRSERFRKESESYTRQECLPCHVPVTMLDSPLEARTWRLQDGIDCMACHVRGNAAFGPYQLEAEHRALADPRYLDHRACVSCHTNSVAEFLATSPPAEVSCQTCHMPSLHRHLAGKIYRFLRKKKKSGRHDFGMADLLVDSSRVTIDYSSASRSLSVTVYNTEARHNLPTGIYGRPYLALVVYLEDLPRGARPPVRRVAVFSNHEGTAIPAAGSRTLSVAIQRDEPALIAVHVRVFYVPDPDVKPEKGVPIAEADTRIEYIPLGY